MITQDTLSLMIDIMVWCVRQMRSLYLIARLYFSVPWSCLVLERTTKYQVLQQIDRTKSRNLP
jgi:hypothetical protein